MNLQWKRDIDTYIGLPLLILTNLTARFLGLVFKRNETHRDRPVKTIVVMKFQGIGSLVIAKPALSHLRNTFPQAKIIFWGTPSTCLLAEQMLEFDQVAVLDDRHWITTIGSLVKTLFLFWKQGIDWAFDLEVYSKFSSILATMTCAYNRVGFAVDSVKYRDRTHTQLVFFNRYEYLGEAYLRLIGVLAVLSPGPTNYLAPQWKFSLTPLDNLVKPYMAVNVNAGELALYRKWPIDYFDRLIQSLFQQIPEMKIVLIGKGESERRESEKITNHPRLVNLVDRLTLHETTRCLSHSELTISNDSFPLHLALTTPTKVLGLFGPTRPRTYFMPNRPNAEALSLRLYCSPCIHHWDPPPCGGDNQCMKRIDVERVLAAALKLLGRPVPSTGQINAEKAPLADSYYPGLVYHRT